MKNSRVRSCVFAFLSLSLAFLFASVLADAARGFPLAIDPFQQWNTFMGGSSSHDYANSIAIDPSGNLYVAGDSEATWGAPIQLFTGARDVFVAKLNSNGTRLWHTFLCPSASTTDIYIAVDANGNSYVIGSSEASWGAPLKPHSGWVDTFIAKLNTNGELQWNTFLGHATGPHFRGSIALDGAGNIYLTGCSMSIWGSPILPFRGGQDAFVAKFNTGGVRQWNTFLGSPLGDLGAAIALTADGNIFVMGQSQSSWSTPVQPHSGGGSDVFVAKLDGNGLRQWHTFMGSVADDLANAVAVDAAGNVIVVGHSAATWGTPIDAYPGGGYEGFVAKLDSIGNLIWNTFVGGFPARKTAVDADGNIYVGGATPGTWGTAVRPPAGKGDASLAKLNGSGVRQWITFLGSEQNDVCLNFVWDGSGNFYLAGASEATWGSPVNPHTGSSYYPFFLDAFVAKITPEFILSSLTVVSPDGGEVWQVGSSRPITWTSSGGFPNVKIEYATDGGTDYTTVVASTPNTGSYTWTIPNTVSANCRVKISEATTGAPLDTSDAAFSIVIAAPPALQLSRKVLAFAAAAGDGKTAPQTIIVNNSGGGILNWTAAAQSGWMTVTPGSGTGTGTLSIGVNPAGLSSGPYTGTIAVSAAGAANSPQTITVNLQVYEGTNAPFGSYETPLEGTAGIEGSVPVTGWALDDVEVANVKIYRDPVGGEAVASNGYVYIGEAVFVEGARPDVEQAYPAYPLNYRAGWGYMMLTNFLPNGGNGIFKIHAVATDKEGNSTLLGSKTITCDNAHATLPFGAIDLPAQGGTASGAAYVNYAWVLATTSKCIPADGSTITAWVDGLPLGHPSYGFYRVDIATLFPGFCNANAAIGFIPIDTTKYPNGVHTIVWSATDSGGVNNGFGSRYFTIQNAGGGAGAAGIAIKSAKARPRRPDAPIFVTKGFDDETRPDTIYPDGGGLTRVEIRELERVEIKCAEGDEGAFWQGYLKVGDELRELPIGATMDGSRGILYWQPGPGFLGDYEFVFLAGKDNHPTIRKSVMVTIRPRE